MSTTLNALDQIRQAGRWMDEAAWLRAREQLRFAEWMTRQKNAAPAWKKCLENAMRHVAEADMSAPAAVVDEVEKILAPLARAAKKYTVFCAGHAHIDMNWMWGWPETVGVTLDSVRTVLTLLEEFPEFHFSQSQASIYAIIEKYEPEMLGRIAEFIKQGRWEVTASHWVENDPNLAAAEALAQHLLQTRAYMKRLFGLEPEDVAIDFAPDSFGFAATTPSYLAQGGVRYVFAHRPGCFQQPVPDAFWWEGPDGARVLAHNAQKRGYGASIDAGSVIFALNDSPSLGLDCGLVVYGVGDHGGGPTRRDLLYAREMASWPVFPTIRLARLRDYYEHVEKSGAKLPVIAAELNTEVAGCYTSQSLIKRDNRIGEARMQDAETLCAIAGRLGIPVPAAAAFDENWRRVLFSHFHDILPGSGVRDTRLYCHGQFQETMAFTSTTAARLLRAIAGRVDTSAFRAAAPSPALPPPPPQFLLEGFGGGAGIAAVDGAFSLAHGHGVSPIRPFVVFNPTAAERSEVVNFTIWDREFPETAGLFKNIRFEAVGADGALLPAQHVSDGFEWGHATQVYAARLSVPPFGYAALAFRQRVADTPAPAPKDPVALFDAKHHCFYLRHERGAYGMENSRLRVVLDSATGRVVSLFDKTIGAELLDPAAGGIALEYSIERAESMSAWLIDPAGPAATPALASMRRKQTSPLSASIELTYKAGRSTIRLEYRLDSESSKLDIAFTADWLEAGSSAAGSPNLRLAIGSALPSPALTAEIPFGSLERPPLPDDKEVPALRWALLESPAAPAALLALNDCKHGHALSGSTLRINLIRSSFEPDPFPELGQHKAAFAIEPVARGADRAALIAKAQAFNHPLLAMGTPVHDGALPPEKSFVKVSGAGVSFSCLKLAADRSGVIIRLCNMRGKAAPFKLVFDKSFGAPKTLEAVDLLERPLKTSAKTIPAKSILTLKATF